MYLTVSLKNFRLHLVRHHLLSWTMAGVRTALSRSDHERFLAFLFHLGSAFSLPVKEALSRRVPAAGSCFVLLACAALMEAHGRQFESGGFCPAGAPRCHAILFRLQWCGVREVFHRWTLQFDRFVAETRANALHLHWLRLLGSCVADLRPFPGLTWKFSLGDRSLLLVTGFCRLHSLCAVPSALVGLVSGFSATQPLSRPGALVCPRVMGRDSMCPSLPAPRGAIVLKYHCVGYVLAVLFCFVPISDWFGIVFVFRIRSLLCCLSCAVLT